MPLILERIVNTPIASGDGDEANVAFGKCNTNAGLIEVALEDAERKAMIMSLTDERQTIADRLAFLNNGSELYRFQMPYSFVVLDANASLNVADSGDDIVLDVLEDDVTIFETPGLVLQAGTDSTMNNTFDPLPTALILEKGAWVSIDVASIATGSLAAGLKLYLEGYVIWTTF